MTERHEFKLVSREENPHSPEKIWTWERFLSFITARRTREWISGHARLAFESAKAHMTEKKVKNEETSAKVCNLLENMERGKDRHMLELQGLHLENESKRLDNEHKRLDLKSKELENLEKELAFRRKLAELKLAGLEIIFSKDSEGNPIIDIAESVEVFPGSIEVCPKEESRRLSVQRDQNH